MWLDLVVVAILGVFVAMGALRGAVATLMGLLSLAAGYAAAVLLAPTLAPALAADFGIPELLAIPLAGTGVFLATYCVMGIVSFVVKRWARGRDGYRSPRDRFLGGILGGARGVLIALLVSWLALWVDALRVAGSAPGMPELGSSRAASVTSHIVEEGLEAALKDAGPAARVVARMAARPAVAVGEFQSVLENQNVAALSDDPMFWTYVEHGSISSALNRGSFLRVIHDETLRTQLADLGLVEEEAAQNPTAFRNAAEDVLREVGPRIRGLKNDPELQALVEDPEVVAMLQSGDTFGLLGHEGFRKLVDRIISQPAQD